LKLQTQAGIGVFLSSDRVEVFGAAGPLETVFTAAPATGNLRRWARLVVEGLLLRELGGYHWRVGLADAEVDPEGRRHALEALIVEARRRGVEVASWFHTSVGHAAHGLLRTPAVHVVAHLDASHLHTTAWVVPYRGCAPQLWRLGFEARFPLGTGLVDALVQRGHPRQGASEAVAHRVAGATVLMAMAAVENGEHGAFLGAPLHVHVAGRADLLRADLSSALRRVLRRQRVVGALERMTPFHVVEPAWLADAALRGADPASGVDTDRVFFVEPLGVGVEIRGRGCLAYFTPRADLGPVSALSPLADCPISQVFWSASAVLGRRELPSGAHCIWSDLLDGRCLDLLEADLQTAASVRCAARSR
jgi:hypothetical protein